MSMIERLRKATEDDVRQALEETAFYGFPQDETDLLRLFKVIVEVVLDAGRNPEG